MNEGFQRVDLPAVQLVGRAKNMISQDYWLFFGITAVALVLGGLVPFGILLAPLMCGVHLCWRAHSRGEAIRFEMLWKGFDHLAPAVVAMVLMMVVTTAVSLPPYLLVFVGMVSGQPEAPAALFGLALFGVVMFLAVTTVQTLFCFVFPLIVDRGLDGIEALKLSYRAATANFGGVFRLTMLCTALGIAGSLCCGVGALFVAPWTIGATWLAYREVFPEDGLDSDPGPELRT